MRRLECPFGNQICCGLPVAEGLLPAMLFRRLLRLHQAERLTESLMNNLLSWVHPGFSVYAGPPAEAAQIASVESQARYVTRPALAMDALQKLDNGNLVMETPPDPRSGATSIALDPFEPRAPPGTVEDSLQ